MTKPHIFLTRMIPPRGLEMVQSLAADYDIEVWQDPLPPAYEVLLQKAQGVTGLYCLLTEKIDANLMDTIGSQVKVISQMAVGFDNVDVPAATARGIPVGNTPGVLTDTTADFAWTLLMAAARRVVEGANIEGEPATFEGINPLKLPFNVEKKTYVYYDTTIQKALPAEFQAEESIEGLNTYKFLQNVPPTQTGELSVPGSVVGSPDATFTAARFYSNVVTVWVDPVTGAIIKGRGTIRGLTTAAGLWLVTGVGLSVGANYIIPAVCTTLISVLLLYRFRRLQTIFPRDEYTILTVRSRESASVGGVGGFLVCVPFFQAEEDPGDVLGDGDLADPGVVGGIRQFPAAVLEAIAVLRVGQHCRGVLAEAWRSLPWALVAFSFSSSSRRYFPYPSPSPAQAAQYMG